MGTLGNTPRSHTIFRLENRKSFAFGLSLKLSTGTPIPLTDTTIRFVMANPAEQGGAILLTRNAEVLDEELGLAQILLQASELSLAEDEYPYSVTVVSPAGYSTVILKGVLAIEENTDIASTADTYAGINPSTSIAAYLENGALIRVDVAALDGMSELVEVKLALIEAHRIAAEAAATAAAASAVEAQTAEGEAESSAASALASQLASADSAAAALASEVEAGESAVTAAARAWEATISAAYAGWAADEADASEATATAASNSASASAISASASSDLAEFWAQYAEDISMIEVPDDVMQTVDSNPGSAFRVQHDARSLAVIRAEIAAHATGKFVAPSGDLTGLTDRVNIQAAIEDEGGALLGIGDYYTDWPIHMRSNTFVVGMGPGLTKIFNTVDDLTYNENTGQWATTAAAIMFLCGNVHPFWFFEDVGGLPPTEGNPIPERWEQDLMVPPLEGDSVVYRTEFTFPVEVGQLVFIKTNAGTAPKFNVGHIRKVVAFEDDWIELDQPLDDIAGCTIARISPGYGASHPAETHTGETPRLQSYLCENTLLQGFSVSTMNAWTARFGVYNGTFRDIESIDTHALIFGNAAQKCHFENIYGNFRARAIETVDGARDNVYLNIRGVQTGGHDYNDDEPLVKLGRSSFLSNFNFRAHEGNKGNWLQFTAFDYSTVRDGVLSGDAVAGSAAKVQFGLNKGYNTLQNLTVNIFGTLQGTIIRMDDVDKTTIRDIKVYNPGGKVGNSFTLRVLGGVTRSLIDNVSDDTGIDAYDSEASGCRMLNVSWRPITSGRSAANVTLNYTPSDQERTVFFTGVGAQTYSISLLEPFGVSTIVRLFKNVATGTLTVVGTDGATVMVDPSITLPVGAYSRLVVEKIDSTTYWVRRG